MWYHVFIIVAASVATFHISNWLGDSLDRLSRAGRINPLVRGLVLDAIASSFPEFATVIVGLMHGTFEVGLGTIAGSAMFNIAVIPAICGIAVGDLRADRAVILRDGVIYLAIVVAFVLVTTFGVTESPEQSHISVLSGWVGIIAYIFYVGMMFLLVGRDNNVENSIKLRKPEWVWHFTRVGLTMVGIGVASHFMVGSGLELARHFGISEVALGVTILAAATSLPDTFLSLRAARRGDAEGAIANAFGSNAFDILICLGVPIVYLGGITVEWSQSRPIVLSLLAATVAVVWLMRDGKLSRCESYSLLTAFVVWWGAVMVLL